VSSEEDRSIADEGVDPAQHPDVHTRLLGVVTVVYLVIMDYHCRRRKTALFSALVTWREPYGATNCCARNADGAPRL
jgi:hypothetical protein